MQPRDIAPVVVTLAIGVPLAVLWAMALVDLAHRDDWEFPPDQGGADPRLFWTFVVVLLSGIGAFFYYFKVMKPYPRQRR